LQSIEKLWQNRSAVMNRTNYEDVARLAGVSLATVYRVMNGRGPASAGTEARVREATKKRGLGALRTRRTKLLAFLLGNRGFLHRFHSRILGGAEACCVQRGYNMLIISLRYPHDVGWKQLQLPRVLELHGVVEGFIVASINSQNLLDLLARTKLPYAVQGNGMRDPWQRGDIDAAYFDDIGGSRQLTAYLQWLGHRDIWFVANREFPSFERSYQAYAGAMMEAGLQPRRVGFHSEDQTKVGYLGAKSILARGGPVTAIFGGLDPTAVGVYEALRECGKRVPEDISVTGFDDLEARTLHPSLTTSHIYLEELGKKLVEFVLQRIDHPELAPQQFSVPTNLIRRESCRFPSPVLDSPKTFTRPSRAATRYGQRGLRERKETVTKAKQIAGVFLMAWVPLLCAGVSPVTPREAQEWTRHLLPLPHEIAIPQKYTLHPSGVAIKLREGAGAMEHQAAKELAELFQRKNGVAPAGKEFEIRIGVSFELTSGLRSHPNWQQAYIIRPSGVRQLLLIALDEKGIRYAANTLQQLLEASFSPDTVSIPLAEITDWPDLEERGLWNFPQAYEPIASMPEEWVPWMASIKLNYGQMQTQIQKVERGKPNHVAIQRDLYQLAQRKAFHFVPFLMHLNFMNDYGLYRAYPELAGKGDEALATRYIAHRTGDQHRVPYASHPAFRRILAEWIADIAAQGADEVSVWLSERPAEDQHADTVATGQSVMEARAVVSAWREAQKRYPNFGLRVFLSTTTSNRYYRVIAELPPEVKIERACATSLERVLHLPRDLLRNPLLDTYAAEGRWIASYDVPLTANGRVETPEFMVPQSSAHRIRDYLRQIAARRYRAAYGMMAWSNKGKESCGFDINALAEWSWNLNGRSEKEFAIAWATREGLGNPEAVGEWSELMGPVEFDVYDSDFPLVYSWGLAAQMIRERKRPYLGEGTFRYYTTPEDFDSKIATCKKALKLAQGIENTYLINETRIVLSYVKLAKSLFQIAEHVATDDLSSLASQDKLRGYVGELNSSAKENAAAIREWRVALGPEPWHYRVHDAIQAPEKTARDVTEWLTGRYFFQ
jgi:DNA-binding LacI/PurR family transcriptional regulator